MTKAMETPAFLSWLDEKMKPYAGKLIPPVSVLHERLAETTRSSLRQRLIEEAIRAYKVDERLEAAYTKLKPRLDNLDGELEREVKQSLRKRPEQQWSAPVDHLASALVARNWNR
jgi:hypothetical protein